MNKIGGSKQHYASQEDVKGGKIPIGGKQPERFTISMLQPSITKDVIMVEQEPKCANWLNYEAIRKTLNDYENKWGASDGSTKPNVSEFNMTNNCMACNMRPKMPSALNAITQIADLFKDPIMIKLEAVGMIRKCYKPMKEEHNAKSIEQIQG